jgi:multiple sugar transport system permease protein
MSTITRIGRLSRHLFFAVIALLMAFPFYWMVTSALKTNDEIWHSPPTLWPKVPLWSNFAEAWHEAHSSDIWATASCRRLHRLLQINSGMMADAHTQGNSACKDCSQV